VEVPSRGGRVETRRSEARGRDTHVEVVEDGDDRWVINPTGAMRVPGVVFSSAPLLPRLKEDQALRQVMNVATLPGVVEASYAMPDIHWGYGFPIGGVAATDVESGGVISPGGVGFDISCGVRLLTSSLGMEDIGGRVGSLMDELDKLVPKGMGSGGVWPLSDKHEMTSVLRDGSRHAVALGYGTDADVSRCEDGGALADASPEDVSDRALERGLHQVGSLGSGNHFLELQVVDEVHDADTAEVFGLVKGQVCVMIHCGSRGLGHQICSDHVREMLAAMGKYGISVPDPQLACAPVESREGRAYLGAMAAAANYGRANRQAISHAVRQAFSVAVGNGSLTLLYDVSHNLAKLETHDVGSTRKLLCVHRKGATRSLPPGHEELPEDLREIGQPVLVPGSMGTASYVLAGTRPGGAFYSTCHGAGRTMSRHAAKKQVRGEELRRELERQGIEVRASSLRGLAEEAPSAYKDVDEVVAICERAGLARRVARLKPAGVLKG
jgi:tRNA-splicing ligase RtcB